MLNGMSSDALFRPCAIPTTEYTKNSKIICRCNNEGKSNSKYAAKAK